MARPRGRMGLYKRPKQRKVANTKRANKELIAEVHRCLRISVEKSVSKLRADFPLGKAPTHVLREELRHFADMLIGAQRDRRIKIKIPDKYINELIKAAVEGTEPRHLSEFTNNRPQSKQPKRQPTKTGKNRKKRKRKR
jgi:hypothetical protein